MRCERQGLPAELLLSCDRYLMSVSETRRRHIRLLDSFTVLSRLSVAALLYLASSYLPLFDASPHLLAPSSTSLLRWDAFHFTAIAKAGYSLEHHWAFFPGVPSLLRFAARFSSPLDDPTFALIGVALVHTAIAIPTTRAIYDLTLTHFHSPYFALLAALLSLLPASPVTLYFAPYAEPIFTFLSYAGVHISSPNPSASCLALILTHLRDARLCAQAISPRDSILYRRRLLPFKRHLACSLRSVVPSGPPLSPIFCPPQLGWHVGRLLPCHIPFFTILVTPTRGIPRILPFRGCKSSSTITLVQSPHTLSLYPRPTHILECQFPLLLDPFPAPQHRSRAPTPRAPLILQHSPYIFAPPRKKSRESQTTDDGGPFSACCVS